MQLDYTILRDWDDATHEEKGEFNKELAKVFEAYIAHEGGCTELKAIVDDVCAEED